MRPPRLGWIGFHEEGVLAFQAVLKKGYPMDVMITLTAEEAAKRSGAAEYAPVCRRYNVPYYPVRSINQDGLELLQHFNLDVAFVIGWSQMVRRPALEAVRVGMIGAHASMLPHNRGSAPINWALIRGERETGNTLFWLNEQVDQGEIIDQCAIPITPYDTCATLYARVARANRDLILPLIPRLLRGERPGRPQPPNGEPLLPRRRPDDGAVEWSLPNIQVYDFVRALTRPYPGAFSWMDGQRFRIWKSALLPSTMGLTGRPGQGLGAVMSPVESACGQAVACGRGAVVLLEVEDDQGVVMRGRRLSEEAWTGRVWHDGR